MASMVMSKGACKPALLGGKCPAVSLRASRRDGLLGSIALGALQRPATAVAAAKKPIYVDHNPSEEFLKAEGVKNWGTWGCDVSKFPWKWSVDEKAYILEGEVYITPADGEPGAGQAVFVKAGDYCVFPGGMSCTWDVKSPIFKHFDM